MFFRVDFVGIVVGSSKFELFVVFRLDGFFVVLRRMFFLGFRRLLWEAWVESGGVWCFLFCVIFLRIFIRGS